MLRSGPFIETPYLKKEDMIVRLLSHTSNAFLRALVEFDVKGTLGSCTLNGS